VLAPVGSPVLRAYSKLEFVTSEQVFTFFVVYSSLYPLENKSFVPDLFKTIFWYRFYLLICLFLNLRNCHLTFAAKVNLNLILFSITNSNLGAS